MSREEFYEKAVLNSIRVLKPGYCYSSEAIDCNVNIVVEFAKKLTDKVYGEK